MTITGRRLAFTALAVILVGMDIGLLLGGGPQSATLPTETFYVVPYHWGFTLYDKDWNEIERMEVEQGTRVRLVAVPAVLFEREIEDEFRQKVVDRGLVTSKGEVVTEYPPGDPGIADIIDTARNDPSKISHGPSIIEFDITLRPKGDASALDQAIDSAEFTAEAIGSFDLVCSIVCGPGHTRMRLQGALVVK